MQTKLGKSCRNFLNKVFKKLVIAVIVALAIMAE